MTPTEFIDFVRRLHNAESDSFWSDQEILNLAQAKSNEVLSIIGLIEAEDTTTSIASQGDYSYPTNAVRIRRVYYNEQPLKLLTFRQKDMRDPTGTLVAGTPREFWLWNNKIRLVPKPSTGSDTIRIFSEKQQGSIVPTGTIDIPDVLHARLANGVLMMMYMKELNQAGAGFYRDIWFQTDYPAFREFKRERRRSGAAMVVTDADSLLETEFGVN